MVGCDPFRKPKGGFMDAPKKTAVIIGATGFIGRELGEQLYREGYQLRIVTRNPERYAGMLPFLTEIFPYTKTGDIPAEALAGCYAVINLAGEPIADHAWTDAQKRRIVESRTITTRKMVEAINAMEQPPKVLVQGSAIGYYGDRGEENLDESSTHGSGFLADTCVQWEAELNGLRKDVRRCIVRTALVLGLSGGIFEQLSTTYASGLGACLGSGEQWVSWIHVIDLVRVFALCVNKSEISGVVNGASPNPIRFVDLHRAIAKRMNMPAFFKAPTPLLRIVLPQRSELFLISQKAHSFVLDSHSFRFSYPTLDHTLDNLFGEFASQPVLHLLEKQWVPADINDVWEFYTDAKNLERITPDWLNFHLEAMNTEDIKEGTVISYSLKFRGIPLKWHTKICEWFPKHHFVDRQIKGPYALWHHRHTFEPLGNGTLLTDLVYYRLPLAPLGNLFATPLVKRNVTAIFQYRKQKIAQIYKGP